MAAQQSEVTPCWVYNMMCVMLSGYNFVTTIPAGATQLDIRQYGQQYLQDDDNYLGKSGYGQVTNSVCVCIYLRRVGGGMGRVVNNQYGQQYLRDDDNYSISCNVHCW